MDVVMVGELRCGCVCEIDRRWMNEGPRVEQQTEVDVHARNNRGVQQLYSCCVW